MTEAEPLPPGPKQVNIKLKDSAEAGVNFSLPLVALGPDHAPEAEQLEAFVEDQEIVTAELTEAEEAEEEIVTVAAGVEREFPSPPSQLSKKITLERRKHRLKTEIIFGNSLFTAPPKDRYHILFIDLFYHWFNSSTKKHATEIRPPARRSVPTTRVRKRAVSTSAEQYVFLLRAQSMAYGHRIAWLPLP